MAEPIEELAIRLVADGTDFLEFIDDAVTQAEERLEGLPNIVDEAMSILVSMAQEAGVQLNQTALAQFESFFQAIVDGANRVAEEGPQAIEDAIQGIIAAGTDLGFQFTPEQVGALAEYLSHIREIGDVTPAAAAAIDEFLDGVEGQINATKEASEAAQEHAEAMDDEAKSGNVLGNVIGRLEADFGKFFKRIIAGLGVMALLRKAMQFVTESVQVALANQEAMFRLAAAINAQQRAQGESAGTMQEWIGFARQIVDEFGRPLERTMLEVAAAVNLMSINLNLSGDEMQALIRHGTALANLHGQNIEPTVRRFVQFIQGGYVEGLRELGIVINDTVLKQTALSLNITDNMDAWTAAEAELIRYTVLLEQSAFALEGAAEHTETLAGRQDRANQAFDRAKNLLGQALLPAWVQVQEVMAAAITTLTQIIFLIQVGLINAFAGASAAIAAYMVFMNDLINGNMNVADSFEHAVQVANDTMQALQAEGFKNLTGDMGQFADVAEEEMGRAATAAEEMAAKVDEAMARASEAIEDAMRDWEAGVEKARQRLSDRLEDIERDFQDRIFDLEVDLQRDLADIDRDAAQDRIETIIDAQVEEIRLREDHARRIQQLETRYLFDLEDAVRERDARRVLQLQRRFNMEREELEDEYELAERRRKQDLQRELADIERRRQIRRQERIRSFQEELVDAELMRQRRREDAQREFERDLRDLRIQIERRLRLQAEAIAEQLKLNAEGLQALYNQLNNAYGPGGWVEAFYRRYAQIVSQAASAVAAGGAVLGAGVGASYGGADPYTGRRAGQSVPQQGSGYLGGYQRGGTLYATSPSMFMAGEVPERIDVTPLSRGGAARGGAAGGGGRAVIEVKVDASERLVVEVADFVENDMADVLINVNRGQEQSRGAFR
jgi:hypothetical protein